MAVQIMTLDIMNNMIPFPLNYYQGLYIFFLYVDFHGAEKANKLFDILYWHNSTYVLESYTSINCYHTVAEFKEFERRFKFKPRFLLKLYQMFQDLSRRLI